MSVEDGGMFEAGCQRLRGVDMLEACQRLISHVEQQRRGFQGFERQKRKFMFGRMIYKHKLKPF